jgi:hypothetical protein
MKYFLIAVVLPLFLHGCANMEIAPADDQWERSEEAMPGIVTGDEGKLVLKYDGKNNHSATTAAPEAAEIKDSGTPSDFQEFKQWQAWKKARKTQSGEYLEFRQWLEFKTEKSGSGGH